MNMNRAYYPVHPTYSQPRQYTASYRSASLPPPPGLPLPVTSFSRIPQHHQYEQIYMASPAQPSTLASTSSSPTLAESEPSKFFPTFKQPADSIVKPWLTHVNPPFSDSLSSDTRNPPPKNRDVQLDFNSNHHPIPYIPTIVRKRAFADPVRYGIESPVWNRHHPWMTSFRAGSITLEPTVRKSHASEIVNNGGIPWDTSIISELTGKFCERVAEGWWVEQDRRGGGGMEWNVAVFAGEVKEGLMLRVGERSSSFFENQLRQCVLSEFRAWWMHKLPSSIVQIPHASPSPPHNPPHLSLHSALSIASFIGSLFSLHLVSASFVLLCLHILVDHLSTLEELHALHAIVSHADERLYERIRMGEIVEVLDYRVEKMGEEIRSVVLYPGSEVVKDKVGILVQLIKDIIQQWALTACTPTPSEASDAVTLYSDDNPDHLNMIMTSSTWTALPIPPPPTPEQLPMAHQVQEEHVDPLKTLRPVLATVVPESVVPRTTVVIRQPASTSSSEGEKLDTQVQEKSPQVGMKKRWADVVRA